MRKKVLIKGPLLTRSGYGEQSRFALRSLRSREDLFEIFIQPLKWGQTSWLHEIDEERKWIDRTIEKTIAFIQQGGKFDMSLQITIPNEWQKLAPVNIGYTAGIETSKVAPIWLQKGNENVDKIITISSHSMNTYKNTVAIAEDTNTGNKFEYRLETPIDFVNYPTKTYENLPSLDLNITTAFNFLSVAQFGPRKNLPNTIKWFVEEFHDEDVGLVLKTNIAKNCVMDRETILADLKNYLKGFPDRKCTVYLLHGDMTDEEMHSLYNHEQIDAFLALPHGEGFGLPIFEAAYSGLPVVATGWSGHLDFLTDEQGSEHFYNVAFDLQPVQDNVVWENVIIKESMWAYPREQSAKRQMRLCYEQMTNEETRGTEMIALEQNVKRLHDTYSTDKMYKKFIQLIGFGSIEIEEDVIFVSDMFANQYTGGAELSLQTIINSIPSGKTLTKVNCSKVTENLITANKDKVWIFGNISQLTEDLISTASENLSNYYFIEYDYKYCEYRNPVLYEFLEDERCEYHKTERGGIISKFINNSKKTFFMSERQKSIYCSDLKNLNKDKMSVLSSTFDDHFFDNIDKFSNNQKNNNWLVLGSRSWVKGSSQSEKWCKDNNLEYEVISGLTPEQVLEKMSKAEGVCFLPTGYDTCPRFVIEAKLLGCKLQLNEHVQHADEEWFNSDITTIREYLRNRKEYFWSQVE